MNATRLEYKYDIKFFYDNKPIKARITIIHNLRKIILLIQLVIIIGFLVIIYMLIKKC